MQTLCARLLMCSFTTGKMAFILPRGSITVVRYGASCSTILSYAYAQRYHERGTYELAADSSIQIINGTLVGMCGHRTFRGLVCSAVEDVDGIC